MADELTLAHSLSFSKGSVSAVTFAVSGKKITVTGTRYYRAVQIVGTTEEALGLGEVVPTNGYAMFHNLDSANLVEVYTATGGIAFCKLLAGEWSGPLRLGSGIVAPFAKATTAPVSLEYMLIEA